jgi:hypothetical protein
MTKSQRMRDSAVMRYEPTDREWHRLVGIVLCITAAPPFQRLAALSLNAQQDNGGRITVLRPTSRCEAEAAGRR